MSVRNARALFALSFVWLLCAGGLATARHEPAGLLELGLAALAAVATLAVGRGDTGERVAIGLASVAGAGGVAVSVLTLHRVPGVTTAVVGIAMVLVERQRRRQAAAPRPMVPAPPGLPLPGHVPVPGAPAPAPELATAPPPMPAPSLPSPRFAPAPAPAPVQPQLATVGAPSDPGPAPAPSPQFAPAPVTGPVPAVQDPGTLRLPFGSPATSGGAAQILPAKGRRARAAARAVPAPRPAVPDAPPPTAPADEVTAQPVPAPADAALPAPRPDDPVVPLDLLLTARSRVDSLTGPLLDSWHHALAAADRGEPARPLSAGQTAVLAAAATDDETRARLLRAVVDPSVPLPFLKAESVPLSSLAHLRPGPTARARRAHDLLASAARCTAGTAFQAPLLTALDWLGDPAG